MNYGEEVAYWYLRFNGFFPLTNFVFHRSPRLHSGDCDVLAIRTPHVFEEIGGTEDDWDVELSSRLDFHRTIGLICEVKTGSVREVFRKHDVDYAVDRLGFAEDTSEIKECLSERHTCQVGSQYEMAKLLIANRQMPSGEGSSLFISLEQARYFIKRRIGKYLDSKYRDRMYFSSTLLQEMIWETKLGRNVT